MIRFWSLSVSISVVLVVTGCSVFELPDDDSFGFTNSGEPLAIDGFGVEEMASPGAPEAPTPSNLSPKPSAKKSPPVATNKRQEKLSERLNKKLRGLDEGEMKDLSVAGVFPPYNRARINPNTKLFLVSGGVSAGHLEEVLGQLEHWQKSGYGSSEIACYYVKPDAETYQRHQQAFDALSSRTEGFYLASPHVLFRHLREVGRNDPDFTYLYVTAPGQEPLSNRESKELAELYPEFANRHRLLIRGGPAGHMNERMRLEALRDGIDGHYLLFVADYLANTLKSLPESCEKFVVLNGDHSGGFVANRPGSANPLRSVPNLTVLTSTRYDREAFSGSGDSSFGKLFLTALEGQRGPAPKMSWRQLANATMFSVERTEVASNVDHSERSRPVYYSNLARESGPLSELTAFGGDSERMYRDTVAASGGESGASRVAAKGQAEAMRQAADDLLQAPGSSPEPESFPTSQVTASSDGEKALFDSGYRFDELPMSKPAPYPVAAKSDQADDAKPPAEPKQKATKKTKPLAKPVMGFKLKKRQKPSIFR